MTQRHYGIRVTNRRPTYKGPAPGGALSGGALIGIIVVTLIVLVLLVYGVSKTINNADTGTSAPSTTAQASYHPSTLPAGLRGRVKVSAR
jgi:hypothetical protein